jgi:hypothetical protein
MKQMSGLGLETVGIFSGQKNHYPSMTLMISLDMRGAGNEVIMRFAQSHDAPPKTEAGDLDHLKGSHRGELGELRLEPR